MARLSQNFSFWESYRLNLPDVVKFCPANDRGGHRGLGQQPRQGCLRHGNAMLTAQFQNGFDSAPAPLAPYKKRKNKLNIPGAAAPENTQSCHLLA
ncbi:MAG: hypothetical protein LBQ14_09650 [Treponema sp.]|jgi:hypothetical protein|nr:hypothetical protein [Treponema sp.]